MNICVFCASSNAVSESYLEVARSLGEAMAEEGCTLVYGGGDVGLMGALAGTLHSRGGHIVGVIPEALNTKERAFRDADELIVTRDLRERKSIMDARADAFIALPGGFGTLEEMIEIITLRQLGLHAKPIVIVNAEHYYDRLFVWIDHLYSEGFAPGKSSDLFDVTDDGVEALRIIKDLI